ncbi:hypothetical protein PL75_05165 [Neisseria arctica]|uniref:DNA gyrase inhibitor YacG n=1 Tax=Neisseria arctica TaxID=1470200 RepID=A0A0J1C446_9NEIS|nr:DNA gyrase inhibitor YacG [Neisseria arctica]KLT73058.1 hypothetical protein PL75_05165 [Neisseria arctica]UOO86782.1 DNA gyrase inhibitor YacG [Neisseria arctica]
MKQTEFPIVKCPTCGNSVAWLPESLYRPFCSQRCKLIDLGSWANEEYTVEAQEDNIETLQ